MSRRTEKLRFAHSIFIGSVAGLLLCSSSNAQTNELQPGTTTGSSNLDASRVFALGMIETGNDDRGIGRVGEISRYQIHPVVWKAYSKSREYRNPGVSLEVARQHWTVLSNYFKEKTTREPSDFDMYVLWNTRYAYYAGKGFDPKRLPRNVSDRAQRFVNLVNRRG